MHIQNFEDEVHALILERGKEYFDSGAVIDVERTPDGWTAEVKGSEEDGYHIILHGETEIDDWHCDCPYDHGPICKHVVAVLYRISSIMKLTEEDTRIAEEKLSELNENDLKQFLRQRIIGSPDLRNAFLDYFDEEE